MVRKTSEILKLYERFNFLKYFFRFQHFFYDKSGVNSVSWTSNKEDLFTQEYKDEEQNVQNVHNCVTCNKQFHDKQQLYIHRKIHKLSESICCKCENKFSTKEKLRNHEKTVHSDEIFCCEQCPKDFMSRKAMELHTKIQHNENYLLVNKKLKKKAVKDTSCKYCQKLFSGTSHLNYHIKTQHEYKGEDTDFDKSKKIVLQHLLSDC